MKLKLLIGLKRCIFRNNYKINGKKIRHNRVNLEYYDSVKNLGDLLSPIIVDFMLQRKGISIDKKTDTTHLLALGSLLGFPFDATVWGTGAQSFIQISCLYKWRRIRKYDVRCVRGPLSANALRVFGYHCPNVYGDPAVLMPLIYAPSNTEKKYDVIYIPHFNNKVVPCPEGVKVLDIQTDDYKMFIDELCKAKKVVSSSLHGIILAEVYGIPAVFHAENRMNEILKYYDWYYSTGRYSINMANTIKEALEMKPMPLPDIQTLQDNLLETFPYDLWEKRINKTKRM